MKSNKLTQFFAAKGPYILALALCLAAIGICGWLYYRNATENPPQLQDPTGGVQGSLPGNSDLPVLGTDPGDDHLQATDPSKPTDAIPQVLKTCAPLEGKTVGPYAMETLAYNETTRDWRAHDGIDIAAEAGTQVCAAADGTVYTVCDDDSMGTTVVIRHMGGYVTVYSSLDDQLQVAPGDTVSMGQPIGTVGNTALLETAIGDHLHFSVTLDGVYVDPATFLENE